MKLSPVEYDLNKLAFTNALKNVEPHVRDLLMKAFLKVDMHVETLENELRRVTTSETSIEQAR